MSWPVGCPRHAGRVSHLFRHSGTFSFHFLLWQMPWQCKQQGCVWAHSAGEDIAIIAQKMWPEDWDGHSASLCKQRNQEVGSGYKTSKPHPRGPVMPFLHWPLPPGSPLQSSQSWIWYMSPWAAFHFQITIVTSYWGWRANGSWENRFWLKVSIPGNLAPFSGSVAR